MWSLLFISFTSTVPKIKQSAKAAKVLTLKRIVFLYFSLPIRRIGITNTAVVGDYATIDEIIA